MIASWLRGELHETTKRKGDFAMSKKLIFILLAAWIALMPMSAAGAQGQPPPGTQSNAAMMITARSR